MEQKQQKIFNEEASANYLIWWEEPNILTIGATTQGAESRARIFPGVNKVDSGVWTYMAAHPILKLHIEEGALKLLSKSGDKDFDEIEPDQAKKFIAGISDIEWLEAILLASKKPTVKKFTQDRINEIMKRITPKKVEE